MLRQLACVPLLLGSLSVAAASQYVTPEYPYGSGSCQYNGDGTASTCAAGAGQTGAKNGVGNISWTPGTTVVLVGTHVETPVVGDNGTSGNPITITGDTGAKLYGTTAFRLNNDSDAAYFLNGPGHSPTFAPFRNGRFTDLTASDPTDMLGWGETLGTAAVITQDTTEVQSGEYASARLQNGSAATTRLSQNVNVTNAQLYELSYYCKSDGTASIAVTFFHASEGLANSTNGAGEYGTWNAASGEAITPLACSTSDTDWTRKAAEIRGDGSNRTPNLRFTVSGTNGSKAYVSRVAWKPLWTNSSGDIWTTGVSRTNSSASHTFLLKGSRFTLQAASSAVTASALWYLDAISTDHAILYLHSPEGDPSSGGYTGGDIWVTGSTTGYGVDINDKDYITVTDLDIPIGGYYAVANLGDNVTVNNVTAKLGNGFVEPGARTNNTLTNNDFRYGDWLFNFSGCSNCTITGNYIAHALKFSAVSNEGGGMSYDSTGSDTDNNTISRNIAQYATYGFASHGATVNPSTGNQWTYNLADSTNIGFWAQDESSGDTDAIWRYNRAQNLIPAAASIGSCVSAGQSVGLLQYRDGNTVTWDLNVISQATHAVMLGISADSAAFTSNDVCGSPTRNVSLCNMSQATFEALTFTGNQYTKDGSARFEYHDGSVQTSAYSSFNTAVGGGEGGVGTYSCGSDWAVAINSAASRSAASSRASASDRTLRL